MGEPLKPVNGKISVQVLIDRPTKELFVNNGRMIVTGQQQGGREALHIGYAQAGAGNHGVDSVTAFAKGGKARLVSLEVHELNASWK
jgi:hypothetical protein